MDTETKIPSVKCCASSVLSRPNTTLKYVPTQEMKESINSRLQVNIEKMLEEAKKADAAESQSDMMKKLERDAQSQVSAAAMPRPGFGEPKTQAEIEEAFVQEISAPNPEEIIIREPGEDEEITEDDSGMYFDFLRLIHLLIYYKVGIEEVAVPSMVFGSAAEKAKEVKAKDKERKPEPEPEEEEEAPVQSMKRKRGGGKESRRGGR